MKYKCDMIQDLMPLCLDNAASESSEKTVIEHLSECKNCSEYYKSLSKELIPIEEHKDEKYIHLAAKIRKRKFVTTTLIGLFVGLFCFICLNYANGYRLNSKSAADLSGRLNETSEIITCYKWKDNFHFYIYDSYSCFDVVSVEKTLLGWKSHDNWLNWPKWSMYDKNIGIETTGELYHYYYDEGVQLFPIIAYDENIKTVEVTCFGKKQTKEVHTGELLLFTFDAINAETNEINAAAYDENGNSIYYYDNTQEFPLWISSQSLF